MGANHAFAQNLAVAVGFRAVIKQQFGHTFVTAIGNGAAPRGLQLVLDPDAFGRILVVAPANPGHFSVAGGSAPEAQPADSATFQGPSQFAIGVDTGAMAVHAHRPRTERAIMKKTDPQRLPIKSCMLLS